MPIGVQADPVAPSGAVNLGIMTPEQVAARIESEQTAAQALQFVQKPEMDALAALVLAGFDDAKRYRAEEIDAILLEDLRQHNGEYDPEKLADLKRAGQPVIFWNLTGEKSRGFRAWIGDVQNFDNGKSWALKPTPIPDLPPDVKDGIAKTVQDAVRAKLESGVDLTTGMIFEYAAQLYDDTIAATVKEAQDRANRMDTLCYDQMVEGGWHEAYRDFLYNLSWAPVAILKGPILRRIRKPEYVDGPFGKILKMRTIIAPTFRSVSPFDIYPSRGCVEVDDGELYEREQLSPVDLEGMKGVKGFQDAAIDKVLADSINGASYNQTENTDPERARLEHKGTATGEVKGLITAIEAWQLVSGKLLKDKGVTHDLDDNPLSDLKVYESNVIVVGNQVIFAALNPDVEGKRPYAKTSADKKPGSFWGQGIPRIMREDQMLVNATIRSLCVDMAATTGFQTIINDMARVPPGEKVTEAYPGKLWAFLKSAYGGNTSEKPLDFWQPASIAAALIRVFETFEPKIDNKTGIPRYAMGSPDTSAAGRTSSGLRMLMTNSARGVKVVLANIDSDIFRRILYKMFHYNMRYSNDESIKGDVIVQCTGMMAAIVNEQMSDKVLAFLNATNNPMDAQIVGLKERANGLREYAKQLQLPKDALVKSEDAIDKMLAALEQQAQAASQGQGQPGMPEQSQQGTEQMAGQVGSPQQVQVAQGA